MDSELERTLKKSVMAQFGVISQLLPGGPEGNHRKSQPE
jgi:hypothetical protein